MMMEYFAALGNEWGLSLSFTQTISSKSFSEAAMSEKNKDGITVEMLNAQIRKIADEGIKPDTIIVSSAEYDEY